MNEIYEVSVRVTEWGDFSPHTSDGQDNLGGLVDIMGYCRKPVSEELQRLLLGAWIRSGAAAEDGAAGTGAAYDE